LLISFINVVQWLFLKHRNDSGQLGFPTKAHGDEPFHMTKVPKIAGTTMRVQVGLFSTFLIYEQTVSFDKLYQKLQKRQLVDVNIVFRNE